MNEDVSVNFCGNKVCRFEVPIGEKCNDYIKEEWFGGETST